MLASEGKQSAKAKVLSTTEHIMNLSSYAVKTFVFMQYLHFSIYMLNNMKNFSYKVWRKLVKFYNDTEISTLLYESEKEYF